MPIAKELLSEFEQQAPLTRKFLERVPQDKLTWKPHARWPFAGLRCVDEERGFANDERSIKPTGSRKRARNVHSRRAIWPASVS